MRIACGLLFAFCLSACSGRAAELVSQSLTADASEPDAGSGAPMGDAGPADAGPVNEQEVGSAVEAASDAGAVTADASDAMPDGWLIPLAACAIYDAGALSGLYEGCNSMPAIPGSNGEFTYGYGAMAQCFAGVSDFGSCAAGTPCHVGEQNYLGQDGGCVSCAPAQRSIGEAGPPCGPGQESMVCNAQGPSCVHAAGIFWCCPASALSVR